MDKGLLQEELIIYLVENNILPVCIDSKINFTDTLQNRKELLNFFLANNLPTDSEAISLDKNRVTVDINKLIIKEKNYFVRKNIKVELSKPKIDHSSLDTKLKNILIANAVKTCYLMNVNNEVLSQKCSKDEPYFSKSVEYAIPLYESMALLLVQREEYKGSFIVAVDSVQPQDEYSKQIIRFLIEERIKALKTK